MEEPRAAAKEHLDLHQRFGDAAVDAAVSKLRAQGQRITAPRQAVLAALASRDDYLTADEIADIVAGDDVHRATVYRTLDLLAETGIVLSRHEPGGATSFHFASRTTGHEHLHGLCGACGIVVPLPSHALEEAVSLVESASGFAVELRHVTFSGICMDCKSERAS